jgi:enoyl-CoA hydratase/carnithine racemase
MIRETSGGYVKTEFHNGITTIEFFHPQSNSLPAKILDELAQAIHRAGNDDDTKVIILRSGGEKAFCAGASFDELIAIQNAEQGLQFFSGFAHVINAMHQNLLLVASTENRLEVVSALLPLLITQLQQKMRN